MLLCKAIHHVSNSYFFGVHCLLLSATHTPISAAISSLLYDLYIMYWIKMAPLKRHQQVNFMICWPCIST